MKPLGHFKRGLPEAMVRPTHSIQMLRVRSHTVHNPKNSIGLKYIPVNETANSETKI